MQKDLIDKTYSPEVVLRGILGAYGLIAFFFCLAIKDSTDNYYEGIWIAFCTLILPLVIHLALKAGFVGNTYFICNDSEIIYRKNFISLVQIRVKYTDIKEVILSQGIIQKKMKIGTVRAITQANIGDAGITLFDIKEYQEIYDFLIEKTKENKLK